MAPQKMQLDHVVLLIPYEWLQEPPSWLTETFTLSPGGQHADGKTENRLVIFRDGTYLELIAFINDDPAKRSGHWWDKPYGVVDYAFTTPEPKLDHESLNHRLRQSDCIVRYADPQPGGRRRPDGVEMEWEVTFPEGVARGTVPFFCDDVTPRERRVPVSDEAATTHPCGALGMGGLVEQVSRPDVESIAACMGAITGVARQDGRGGDDQSEGDGDELRFEIGMPVAVDGLKQPSIRLQASDGSLALELVVQTPGRQQAPDPIRRAVGDDGLISISFET